MSDIIKARHEKLGMLRKKGIDPFGGRFPISFRINELIENFDDGKKAVVAGRIMAKRKMGKSIFSDLRDETAKIQLYLRGDISGAEKFELFDSS